MSQVYQVVWAKHFRQTIITNGDFLIGTLRKEDQAIEFNRLHKSNALVLTLDITKLQEVVRLAVNTWIRSESNEIIVVDAETATNKSGLFSDSLHPNSAGALVLGTLVASAVNYLIPDGRVTDNTANDINYVLNGILFTGTL